VLPEGKNKMKITKRQLRRIIKEAIADSPSTPGSGTKWFMNHSIAKPPSTPEEWMYWGDEYGLSAEVDNDGQTMFYLSADQPDRARIAAEAVKAGAQVDTDNDGNDMIYTGVYNNAEGGVWSDEKDYEAGFKS